MLRNRLIVASRNRKGFTLIELLVVVLILAILMSVALPLYLSAVADSQKKACRANLQTVATAVQAARVKSGAADYRAFIGHGIGAPTEPDITCPFCPNGGIYTISQGSSASNTTFQVNCTLHGKFEPGVDSQ
jgi:type IV pilus assembly protein PilA